MPCLSCGLDLGKSNQWKYRRLKIILPTCSAKYTLLPHLGHCGVTPPHCRTGLGVASPSAAPYLVPVDVCFTGVFTFSNDRADTDELDRPGVADMNFGGLSEVASKSLDV